MIRISIIAPAMAIRAGLRALLSNDPQIQVIAEATSLDELKETIPDADVVIWSPSLTYEQETVDVDLNKLNIGETAALLLIHNDPKVINRLLKLSVRAWGVLDPESTQGELLAGVHALSEGLVAAEPLWLKDVFANPGSETNGKHDLVEPLSEREIEILQLLAYGLTNKQIAARLKISSHTVKFHVSTIFSKLGTTNRVETVNVGFKKGLIVL